MGSYLDITGALEAAVLSLSPLDTEFENQPFDPPSGEPYQRITFLPASPDDPTYAGGMVRENGLLQVDLCYPKGDGAGPAVMQAETLRAALVRGVTHVQNATTVQFSRTATIFPAKIDADRFIVTLRWTYFANVA